MFNRASNMIKRFSFIALLAIIACTALRAQQKKKLPIIDMHLHAAPGNPSAQPEKIRAKS